MSEKLKQKFSSTINSNHMLKSKNEYEAKLVAGIFVLFYSCVVIYSFIFFGYGEGR